MASMENKQTLSDMVFDVKEKLSDEEYKNIMEKIESLAQEIIEKISKNDISDTDITNATTFLQATWDTINAETVHPSVRILKKPN